MVERNTSQVNVTDPPYVFFNDFADGGGGLGERIRSGITYTVVFGALL